MNSNNAMFIIFTDPFKFFKIRLHLLRLSFSHDSKHFRRFHANSFSRIEQQFIKNVQTFAQAQIKARRTSSDSSFPIVINSSKYGRIKSLSALPILPNAFKDLSLNLG